MRHRAYTYQFNDERGEPDPRVLDGIARLAGALNTGQATQVVAALSPAFQPHGIERDAYASRLQAALDGSPTRYWFGGLEEVLKGRAIGFLRGATLDGLAAPHAMVRLELRLVEDDWHVDTDILDPDHRPELLHEREAEDQYVDRSLGGVDVDDPVLVATNWIGSEESIHGAVDWTRTRRGGAKAYRSGEHDLLKLTTDALRFPMADAFEPPLMNFMTAAEQDSCRTFHATTELADQWCAALTPAPDAVISIDGAPRSMSCRRHADFVVACCEVEGIHLRITARDVDIEEIEFKLLLDRREEAHAAREAFRRIETERVESGGRPTHVDPAYQLNTPPGLTNDEHELLWIASNVAYDLSNSYERFAELTRPAIRNRHGGSAEYARRIRELVDARGCRRVVMTELPWLIDNQSAMTMMELLVDGVNPLNRWTAVRTILEGGRAFIDFDLVDYLESLPPPDPAF